MRVLPLIAALLLCAPAWAADSGAPAAKVAPATKAAPTKAPAKTADPAKPEVKPDAQVIKGETKKVEPKELPKEPENVQEALPIAKGIWEAFKSGKHREGVALVIMLVIFFWRRFASGFVMGKIKDSWGIALVTAIISYLASIPMALTATGFSWKVFV